ncbi:hypothetical protein LJB88_02775 [Erysipelotrichaceae bacterium OttesenSCG-928-M19]|nr:hypothetical protein [Erysipelotrichaceae bacterium OttesenSCG-928-M19]
MKCYNCNSIITMQNKCPVCGTSIKKEDYNLPSTKKILNKVKTIKEFAHFIGMFYVRSLYLLIGAIIAAAAALFFLQYPVDASATGEVAFMAWNRIAYMVLAVVFILFFNYYLEMRKIETFYKDYQKNENSYYILWPFKTEYRSIICDASDKIPDTHIMKKRFTAWQNRDKEVRHLRFNSYKLFHVQKAKLFYTKENFYKKHFDPRERHYLKTFDYDDESYVIIEGTVHGFLMTKNSVITIFNTPKVTLEVLGDKRLLTEDFAEETKQRYQEVK